ncbi:D-alanyl-D-alanine carboxypeptidase [uncultured Christiangramia sp.]|uniref:D-alanyl-D-alanine carboxypeptidase n=1 Tax=uncultured Christiangramia sp. TaxID=503836 RepID=UPI00260760FC|nr:D-alanyl-D-alanine carboxypeptidase [uncultured Christiangramia sp.]
MRLTVFLAVLFILGLSSCATSLSRKTTKFEKIHHGFTGIALLDAETGKNIYQYNAHKSFTPASNTKILSLYSAIKFLEDSIITFRYRKAKDSLIFSATGDPGLLDSEVSSSTSLQFLRNSKDSIYYQKANWKQKMYGAGWSWDDFEYAFSPQISAIPVYGNTASFTMENKDLKVSPEIFSNYTRTINSETLEKLKGTNEFRIPQKLQKNDTLRIPFETSEELSIRIIEEEIGRTIKIIPPGPKACHNIKSVASDSVYKQMMHTSDNLIAEQVLIMISEKMTDTMSTKISIDHAKNNIFKGLPDEFQWADGSGLSRYNMNTPANLAIILKVLLDEKGKAWVSTIFPTAGKHGTLANLLTDEEAFVFAKSGSLKNNYSLSGYLKTNSDRLLTFSIMNSNHMSSAKEIKAEVSKLLIHIRNNY